MVRKQVVSGPGIVEWALPLGDIGRVRATVCFGDDELDPDDAHETWCPVCGAAETMRAAMTPDGRRFDLCDGCGLLWHVDRRLGRAVAYRVSVPRPPAHDPGPEQVEEVDESDVRLGSSPRPDGHEGADDPARTDAEATHPLAS